MAQKIDDPSQKLLKQCADITVMLNMVVSYATVGKIKDTTGYTYRDVAKIIDEEQEKKWSHKLNI